MLLIIAKLGGGFGPAGYRPTTIKINGLEMDDRPSRFFAHPTFHLNFMCSMSHYRTFDLDFMRSTPGIERSTSLLEPIARSAAAQWQALAYCSGGKPSDRILFNRFVLRKPLEFNWG